MGYTKRTGTQITDFWPDDDENTLYIPAGCQTLTELLELASKKWPGVSFDMLAISSEYIHTYCIYYDLYDPSDYTNFILLTKIDR